MKNELSRALTHRHVQMIAIGGAIGTGLFLDQVQQFKRQDQL